MSNERRGQGSSGEDLVYAVAGLADLALSRVERGAGLLRGLLRRDDLGELAREGHQDLKARGELALKRHAVPEAHMEQLARIAAARLSGTGGA
ncbi:polyprenyl synthetase [Kitasatospora sp. NPDC002040]|uniref:polyprenyl synthetase n=1 Tax=Kitasatospora sp. NPDC002040 TaxID=3154661 RepID=UPI00332ACCE8